MFFVLLYRKAAVNKCGLLYTQFYRFTNIASEAKKRQKNEPRRAVSGVCQNKDGKKESIYYSFLP